MSKQKITFSDIAKYTNFSKTTISRYFNSPDSLTEKNRSIIKKALDDLGYQENKIAQVLAKGQTEFIGIIIPNLYLHYYSAILNQILTSYSDNHYKFLVFLGDDDIELERQYIQELQAYNIQGLITLSHTIPSEELASYNIPIVSIEREAQFISSVNTNNHLGGVQATSHLIKNNCDILIHINNFVNEDIPAYGRIAGFKTISSDSDIPYQIYQKDLGSNYSEISQSITQLFKEIDKNYAGKRKGIFLANDTYANIFLNAVFQKYGCLPDNYKIIGFDDSPIASEAILPLSSIKQDISKITETALDILQDLIQEHRKTKGKQQTIQHREVAPKLIKRNTTD